MKKTRKILALVLAAMMLVGLTACGGGGEAKEETPAPEVETNQPATEAPADDLNGFPNKPIRVIIPYAAGGNSDLNARKLAEIIDKYDMLDGQQVVVTNIQGAATQEAFNALMTADPDGYTLLLQHNAISTQPAFGNVTFTMDDVDAVCQVLAQPWMLFADADAPYNNTEELIAYCKANPDKKLTMGLPGVGSSGQIGVEVYLDQTGLRDNMQFVYYGGGGDSMTGHLSGECVLHGGFATDGMRYVESGDFKVIAVSGEERVAALPDVECFGELDFDTNYMTIQGLWATKGTPEAVIDYLAEVFMAACDTPEYKEYLETSGCSYAVAGPDDWYAAMKETDNVICELVERLNLAAK